MPAAFRMRPKEGKKAPAIAIRLRGRRDKSKKRTLIYCKEVGVTSVS